MRSRIRSVINSAINFFEMKEYNEDGLREHGPPTTLPPFINESKNYDMLPIDMRFNDGHLLSIVAYSILMIISAIGNITVLALIVRRRRKAPSRINLMLMHLAIADLLVSTCCISFIVRTSLYSWIN